MKTDFHPLEILHVEDSTDDALLFRASMKSVSVNIGRIIQVPDLAGALRTIQGDARPDIVFLDLTLPDAWGLEGLKELLREDPTLIIIVLTGSDDPELPLRGLELGAQDYLSKQEFSAEMLARVIRFALYRSDAQRVLRTALDEAQRSNQAKSQFLANVGHEIKTPLNVMMGFTDLFASEVKELPDLDTATLLDDLKTVSDAQEHLLDLLNELLDMAKLDSGHFRLQPRNFSFHQIVENVVELFRESSREQGNTIHFELPPTLPEEFFGDAKRLRQILLNLLSNANKFTREGRIEIRIDCRPTSSGEEKLFELEIAVKDSGIGIAEADQERIFDFFQQVDDGHTRAFEGSGIGLTICQQLTRMMGGQVTVESQLGRGSTFTARLQIAAARESADLEVEAGQPQAFESVRNRTALIVEDERGSRRLMRRTLETMGMRVHSVSSAEEAALALVAGDSFEFIVLDVHLPGQSGVDLIQALKSNRTPSFTLPRIVVASGDPSEVLRELCAEQGIHEILQKPFAPRALCDRILEMA